MKSILIFGAGRSAFFTIEYLLQKSSEKQWHVTIADAMQQNLGAVKNEFPGADTVLADISNEEQCEALIEGRDIVISLLPAMFHINVARLCLKLGTHLITPSYISAELLELDAAAKAKGLIFLNEIGLDPGIDHMSSMHIIHRLKDEEARILSYRSWCGGLIAEKDCNNPWSYKFSWAPYNVIRAGKDGAVFKEEGRFRFVPYHHLFSSTEKVQAGEEVYEGYYNRDSTHYIDMYGLQEADTFMRGTLRYPGFCKKWNLLVDMGLTADNISITMNNLISWPEYIKGFHDTEIADTEVHEAFEWLMADSGNIALENATPAANLQKLLENKWKMNPGDHDRVVMLHEIEFERGGARHILRSWMDIEGEDAKRTAMARTVGLPLAMAAELIADGKIETYGVILPTVKEIYQPLLALLDQKGIRFTEQLQAMP